MRYFHINVSPALTNCPVMVEVTERESLDSKQLRTVLDEVRLDEGEGLELTLDTSSSETQVVEARIVP